MNKVINITPKEIAKALYDLLDEIEELEDKYENAVADYEYEKYKNSKAIEYIKSNELDIVMVELLEILGDKEQDIEFDLLKALNTDLDDDVEMG